MPRPYSSFVPLCILILFVTVGCGRAPEPAAEQAAPPVERVALTPEHMQDHFVKVREIEEAIIRGDLEAARTPARWLAEHPEVSGPQGTERPLKDMKSAAEAIASAQDIDRGASEAATIVGTCGSCHTAARVEPPMPAVAEVVPRGEAARQMLEHQHAVDRLYRGLIVPASNDWHLGAEALKAAPLRARNFKEISDEITAAEQRFKELADRAIKAPDKATRVEVYGSIIGSCAHCHGLHGRVWGPGLAKTD